MNKQLLAQMGSFNRVNIPKYIEVKIQQLALEHLELRDMGQLRDRMEGQAYYDKLRLDIYAEYAFEYLIGQRIFDWDKRKSKKYKRRLYDFEGKKVVLILFVNDDLPKLSPEHCKNSIFVYVNKNDNRVLVSGLATKKFLGEIDNGSRLIEVSSFGDLVSFTSVKDLIEISD